MAAIPVRLPPLPGEALDSWLEAYADLLHVTVRDIFALAGADWDRLNGGQRQSKPWLCQLDEPDLAALSAVTRVPAATLAGMTLARYQGTGLAEVTAPPGMRRTPRWWRQLTGSRYCPRCLAANGGRWMLAWRIPWTFACTSCQVLLADTCPDCGRRHQRTRTGQPRQPGAFPPDVWSVFARPGAEQRIRRLLAVPGHPGLHHAARQLGIRNAILTGQVRQLEAVVGTALLRTRPDGRLALTAYGERFARDLTPVLNMLAEPDHGSWNR